MPLASGRFEALGHGIDGQQFTVPLLLDDNRNPFHEYTEALLRAAEIIAPQLEDGHDIPLRLGHLIDQVGVVLAPVAAKSRPADLEGDGLVIEGDKGIGSVIVKKEAVVVAIRERPKAMVPPQLFFDMLRGWDQLIKGQNQTPAG